MIKVSKNKLKGKSLKESDLVKLAYNHKSVVIKHACGFKVYPAAFILNWNYSLVINKFKNNDIFYCVDINNINEIIEFTDYKIALIGRYFDIVDKFLPIKIKYLPNISIITKLEDTRGYKFDIAWHLYGGVPGLDNIDRSDINSYLKSKNTLIIN